MSLQAELKSFIRDVPDFPKPGILFKDFTPLLENAAAFKKTIDHFIERYRGKGIAKVAVVESRGFVVGAPVAVGIDAGCVVVRKKGKLPYKTDSITYDLEYGTDTLEIHQGAIRRGEKVLVMDDLLATGGTMGAVTQLIQKQGGEIVEAAFIIELLFLDGKKRISPVSSYSVIQY